MLYLLFGDSIGLGADDIANGGYAAHLRTYLDLKEEHSWFTNLSVSGDTTRGLVERLGPEASFRMRNKPDAPHMIIIAIGVNDTRINNADTSTNVSASEFRKNLSDIYTIAKTLTPHVLAIGILPVYEPRTSPFKEQKFYSNTQIKKYNAIIKECCNEKDIPFKDLYSTWISKDLGALFEDGLHPNTQGHRLLYEELKDWIIDHRV